MMNEYACLKDLSPKNIQNWYRFYQVLKNSIQLTLIKYEKRGDVRQGGCIDFDFPPKQGKMYRTCHFAMFLTCIH